MMSAPAKKKSELEELREQVRQHNEAIIYLSRNLGLGSLHEQHLTTPYNTVQYRTIPYNTVPPTTRLCLKHAALNGQRFGRGSHPWKSGPHCRIDQRVALLSATVDYV